MSEDNAWAPGGIFGQGAVDGVEVLDELAEDGFDDGMGGVRPRPGLGNILGAQDAIAKRRRQAERREKMLTVERIIDEMPELPSRLFERAFPGLREEGLRVRIMNWVTPSRYGRPFPEEPTTIPQAFATRVNETVLEVVADVYRRSHRQHMERVEAGERLGMLGPFEWADGQAERVVGAPKAVVNAIARRLDAIVDRVEHVVRAFREPLDPAGNDRVVVPDDQNESP